MVVCRRYGAEGALNRGALVIDLWHASHASGPVQQGRDAAIAISGAGIGGCQRRLKSDPLSG
jgi:hypothetical protein